jgi:signal transduction histidine kinase
MASTQGAPAGAWLTERGFGRSIIATLVLGFAILAAVVVAAVWLLLRAQDFSSWVDHTYIVETQVAEFRVQLERAEAARRGYLISGDARHRVLFETSARNLPPLVAGLRSLTADNPDEQRRLDRLEPLLRTKLALLHDSMLQRQAGGLAEGLASFLHSEDQATLDELRAITTEMTTEERRLLARRNAQATANAELLLVVIVLAGALLALVAVASSWIMRRYARDLEGSQAALRRLNEGLEDAVRTRTADLTRANQEIQRFAYIVSHDLRSPLVNIMGFTSELEAASKPLHRLVIDAAEQAPQILTADARQAVELDLPESVDFIRSSAHKMDRLISAILKLSREGRRTLNPEPIAMNGLIDGIIHATRTQIDERGAEVSIEGVLPDIVGDRLATEQVFSNLIENALKYLKPGRPGQIVIRGRIQGDRVVYAVQDNGRGIAEKDHERIFELFRRAGPQDQPGEGIGLAHVRALIYRLNGAIDCVSALDQGATFHVTLPRILTREEGEQP